MGKARTSLVAAVAAGWLLSSMSGVASAAYPPAPSWQADAIVRAIAFGDGAMYVGGELTSMRPPGAGPGSREVDRHHAAAMRRKTGKLLPWSPDVNGTVFAIAVHGNVVYLGGSFSRVGSKNRSNLAAVDADTGRVRRWHPGTNGPVRAIRVSEKGGIYVGGSFTKVGGEKRRRLAKLKPDGTLAPWSPEVRQVDGQCPPRCPPVVFTIDLSADGDTVYFGGHFGLVNGVSRNEVAAVPTRGSGVRRWNPDVFAPTNCDTCQPRETHRVYNLIITQHKAYMCGGFWKAWHQRVKAFNVLVTNLTTGAPDPVFAAGDDGDTTGCALKGGVLYLGGHFNYAGPICSQNPPPGRFTQKCTAQNSTVRHHAAAVDAETGKLLRWNPTANSSHGIWTIVAGPRTLAFGGHFTRIGGRAQEGFARYVV